MIQSFHRSRAKKPESGLFTDWIENNTDDFCSSDWPKWRYPLVVVDFSLHFCLHNKHAVNTHASSLWNFCQLSFLEFEECLNRNFSHWNIFHFIIILKSCSQKFTDHLNAIWLRVQVTGATNRFTFQIINSWIESWPGLAVIPPSATCELFWAIFAFATLFSLWNIVHQPKNFFHCFRLRKPKVNKLLPVNSLFICSC